MCVCVCVCINVGLLVSPRLSVGGESYVLRLSFCRSVCLSSREFTFRPSNLKIACSIANSLSPLMEKVYFYCTFVSREPRTVYKVRKVEKTMFWAYESQIPLSKIDKGLEDLSTHNL